MSIIPGLSYTEALEMSLDTVEEYLEYDKIERDIESAFKENANTGK